MNLKKHLGHLLYHCVSVGGGGERGGKGHLEAFHRCHLFLNICLYVCIKKNIVADAFIYFHPTLTLVSKAAHDAPPRGEK